MKIWGTGARWYWKPRIALRNLGYDNNLFHESEEPQGSFTATLNPGVDLLLPIGKRNLLRLIEDLDLVYYAKDPPGFYMNNDASLLYDLYLNRVHLALGDQYVTRYQRQNDELDARVRRNNNLLFGDLLVDVSPRVQLGLTHESDKIEYDDNSIQDPDIPDTPDSVANILDRTERVNGVLLRYDALPRTAFSLRVRHTDYDFVDPDSTRQSSEMRYLMGAEFDPSGILNGELELGYSKFTAPRAEAQDFDGLVGNVNVTWKTKPWLHFRVTGVRDRLFSTYASNLYFLRRSLEGRFSLRIGGLGWLDLGYGWGSNEYPVEDVNIGTAEDSDLVRRDDQFRNPIVGFRYHPREGMVVGLEAKYRSRDSNYASEYDRLFVAVSVSLSR